MRQGGHDEQRPAFSDDFKRDAVAQITERGYPVREVAERLGVSQYSLNSGKKKFAKASSGDAEKDALIRRLKKELARVSEERDILKKWRGLSAIDGVDGSRSRHRIVP
ncbi:transposase, partial [Thioclava atlantica]|uniref:transposase n=1 Tax=Thioclava atlantica TaxID=1317124 RepID=UPI000691DCD9